MTGLNIHIDFGKLPDAIRRGERIGDGLKVGLKAGALYLKGKWAVYPPVRRRKVDTSLWTPKQRRGFFAKLNAGEIEVPYRRGSSPGSQRLAQRFAVSMDGSGRSVTVGNNSTYSRVVLGPKKVQAFYHK